MFYRNKKVLRIISGGTYCLRLVDTNKKVLRKRLPAEDFLKKTAATYSPTSYRSTIGVSELNFSVRNGKRWNLTAITT